MQPSSHFTHFNVNVFLLRTVRTDDVACCQRCRLATSGSPAWWAFRKSFHLYGTWFQPQHAHLNCDYGSQNITVTAVTSKAQERKCHQKEQGKAPNVQRSGSSKAAHEINFSKRNSTRAATPLSCSQWRASNNCTDVTLLFLMSVSTTSPSRRLSGRLVQTRLSACHLLPPVHPFIP